MTVKCCVVRGPFDQVMLAERDDALLVVTFGRDRAFAEELTEPDEEIAWTDGRRSPARRQLEEYFKGRRREFELELAPRGTPFQQSVWRALCDVPFGATTSYSEIAEAIGRPTAVRAVGAANGKNPIAIVVPCHRIIGRDGSLTGYAGGLERKRRLLEHEGVGLPLSRGAAAE